MKILMILALTSLMTFNVFAGSEFSEISEDEGMSHLDLLKHADLDDISPNKSNMFKLDRINNTSSRLSEKYSDRNLAKLVVIINRAPEGTASDAQTARVYVDGKLMRTFKVSTGTTGYESRIGYFRPVYTNHLRVYDNYYSSKYKSLMAKAIFYSGGYAIHHTDATHKLGKRASHGCVRFHIDDISYISEIAMNLGSGNYERRSWAHANMPSSKKNNHFKNLERDDVNPIDRMTGKIDYTKTIKSLDMVILVKDQRN